MKNTRWINISLVLLFSLIALPILAQQQDDMEVFRADLLTYVRGLSRVSPDVMKRYGATDDTLARAEQSIAKLSPEELRAMKEQLDRVPFWRDVPAIVAYTSGKRSNIPRPSDLARNLTPAGISADAIRQPVLAFVRSFKSIPAETVDPQYQQRIARVEALISNATPEELLSLSREIQARAPEWNERVQAAMNHSGAGLSKSTSSSRSASMIIQPNSNCGQDFAGVICEIGNIINDVVSFFQHLPQYASDAFNSIKNIFTNLVANLPGTLAAAIQALGLNNVDWSQVAQTAKTYIKLPCPNTGTTLPGFGRVGDLRTFTNFSGTIGFAGNTIQDVMPSDILTSLDAQALTTALNFPVQWLSRCLENSWNQEDGDNESKHHDLVTEKLDVQVSTRASQASLNSVQGQEVVLSGDVAKIEGKLDLLNTVADAIETVSNRLDTTSLRVETKIDNLQLQQGQTSDSLKDFRAQLLRMHIEEDLQRSGSATMSLFQLPQIVGGFLEVSRSIVEDTLAKRQAAGVNITFASKFLASAIQQLGLKNYKAAYSDLRRAYQNAIVSQ